MHLDFRNELERPMSRAVAAHSSDAQVVYEKLDLVVQDERPGYYPGGEAALPLGGRL